MAVLSTMGRQRGQSMTEYMVIVVWGILVISNDTMLQNVDALVNALKNRHAGMIYGVSLSDPPQADSLQDYMTQIAEQRVTETREEAENFVNNLSSTDVADYVANQLMDYAGEQISGGLDSALSGVKDSLNMEDQLSNLWKPPSPKPGFSCQ